MVPLVILLAATLASTAGLLGAATVRWRRRRTSASFAEARVRAVAALAGDGMVLLDEHDVIVWVSDTAVDLLEVVPGGLIGRTREQIAADDVRTLLEGVDLVGPRGPEDDVAVARHRPGLPVQHLRIGGTQLRRADGCYLGAAMWLRDVTEGLRADRRLRDSETQHRRLVEAVQDVIWTCDRQLTLTFCNRASRQMLGVAPAELVGVALSACVRPEQADRDLAAVREVLNGSPGLQLETTLRRIDGQDLDVSVDLAPLTGDDGEIVGVSGIVRDVTARLQADAERERAARRQAAVADLGHRVLVLPDLVPVMQDAANTLTEVLGLAAGVVLEIQPEGGGLRAAAAAGDGHAIAAASEQAAPSEQRSHIGLALRTGAPVRFADLRDDLRFGADSALRDAAVRGGFAVPILVRDRTFGLLGGYDQRQRRFDPGEIAFAQSVANVIGAAVERHELERAELERALRDPVTGLPNRTLFTDRLRSAIARARRSGTDTAVLLLGVDGFKAVNEEFGYGIGDELLAQIARRLGGEVRACDTVARLGGDEFAIVCEGLGSERDAVRVAEHLATVWHEPFCLESGDVLTTVSIGVAVLGASRASADQLLLDADAAMRGAKRRGRGHVELFDEELRARAGERMHLELELHRALERGQLRLVYQPVVDVRTGTVAGAEALLRWDHPELGAVSPMQFIPAAERTGDIVAIGEWVLRQAAVQVAQWQQRWPGFLLSVNVSGRQIADPGLPDRVAAIARDARLSPGTLGLEITESVLMEADGDPEAVLTRLRAAGARLLLDDFGTGYSSLSYLRRFPLDTLKIDRSFIDGLGADDEDSAIVAAIVQLASTLDMTVVAEGVETGAQLDRLSALRCDLAQGYLLSRPIPPGELEALLGEACPPVLRVG